MRRILSALPLLVSFSVGARAAETRLVVRVAGFQDASGQAVLDLHDSVGSIVRTPPVRRLTAKIGQGAAEFVLDGLPDHRWAFVVYHDRNGNGILDHSWLRIPQEPMGFSRGFRPGLVAGMPDWNKLAVPVKAPADTLLLEVR